MRSFVSCLLLLFLLDFPASLFAQVLTLNRSECVQVDARFSEMVPHHKYQPEIMVEGSDIFTGEEDTKPDTSAIKIEDSLTVFFVWRNNDVLRIVARNETNKAYISKADSNISLPVVSLIGKSQEQASRQLLHLQQLLARSFMQYQPDKTYWNVNAIAAKTPLNMDVFGSGR